MRQFGRALALIASTLIASAASLLAAAPALAGEVAIGGFAHDTSFGVSGTPHENGTNDIQLLYRTETFHLIYLLNPKFYAKVQVNAAGDTDFYTIGIDWRRHLFHSKFYLDAGVGGSYQDGYNTYPGHFDITQPPPGPTASAAQVAQYQSNVRLFDTRKALGSDFLFNPNFTIGYDINKRFSVEGAYDHYSNAGLGGRNPGLDTFGGRLVFHFGPLAGTRF